MAPYGKSPTWCPRLPCVRSRAVPRGIARPVLRRTRTAAGRARESCPSRTVAPSRPTGPPSCRLRALRRPLLRPGRRPQDAHRRRAAGAARASGGPPAQGVSQAWARAPKTLMHAPAGQVALRMHRAVREAGEIRCTGGGLVRGGQRRRGGAEDIDLLGSGRGGCAEETAAAVGGSEPAAEHRAPPGGTAGARSAACCCGGAEGGPTAPESPRSRCSCNNARCLNWPHNCMAARVHPMPVARDRPIAAG